MQSSSGHGSVERHGASLKLHRYEDLQICPKTEVAYFVLTSGILSKGPGIVWIIAIRFAYEMATFNVSAL
jgi:hypothetical protein